MKTFFTSDTHFFHANVIGFCARPFNSVEEMNTALINNWNNTVGRDDHIWFLGDFSFGPPDPTHAVLRNLNGIKHLIQGNHDRHGRPSKLFQGENWKEYFVDKHDYYRLKVDNQKFVLCHFPFASWERGYINLHGHLHTTPTDGTKNKYKQWDVGVDNNDYYPISVQTAVERAEKGVKGSDLYN
jgi:calcineurin-like phosphoesterase family protein